MLVLVPVPESHQAGGFLESRIISFFTPPVATASANAACSPAAHHPNPHIFYKSLILSLLLPHPSDGTSCPALEQSQCFGLKATGHAVHPLPPPGILYPAQSLRWCYFCSHSWAIWDSVLSTISFLSSHFSTSGGDQEDAFPQGLSVVLGLWLMAILPLCPSHQGPAFSSQPEGGTEWCQEWGWQHICLWGQWRWPSVPGVTDHPASSLLSLLPKRLTYSPLFIIHYTHLLDASFPESHLQLTSCYLQDGLCPSSWLP